MRILSILIGAVVGACVAFAPVAEAQRHGGKPVAAYPGAKPTTGGHHWRGGPPGGWSGRHPGHVRPGWHRPHHHHRHVRVWPAWGVGVGFGLGWPYWGWPHWGAPVAVVEGPIYVNPDPMPAYGAPPFRWYCPASAAYYPDVRECARPWLKVIPNDRGPAPPPVSGEAAPSGAPSEATPPASPPEPASPSAPSAPRPGTPNAPDATAANGRARFAAPRMTPPAQLVASHEAERNGTATRESPYDTVVTSEAAARE
jgi:hypothetical protein